MVNLKLLFVSLCLIVSIAKANAQESESSSVEIKKFLSLSGKYFVESDNGKSLDFAHKALKIALRNKNYVYAAKCYNLIGLNYVEHINVTKGIEYYKKGLELANITNNDTIKDFLSNNIANAYSHYEIDVEKSIPYYYDALAYSKKINDNYEITFTKLNLVIALFKLEKFKEGFNYLNEVKEYVEKEGDLEAKITLNTLFANYYHFYKDHTNAEKYYLKAFSLCDKNDDHYLHGNVIDVLDNISDFYENQDKIHLSHFYLKKKDSLNQIVSENYKEQVFAEIGSKIDRDEAKRKIENFELENELQENEIKNNRIIVTLFFIILIFLSLLVLSLYRNNNVKIRSNLELKKANEELKKAKEYAENALQIKSQFISTISHELRTPLYGVIGTTDIIEEEHKELENSPHLKALKFSANYLLALVNDILKVYKIEENKVVLENNLFHLKDKLSTIKDSLETIARKNKNQLKVKVDDAIPEFLLGDNVRLSQIIINLLSNSLKFTNEGKVNLNVSLQEVKGELIYIKFVVSDTGIGIPEKYQEAVFDKFVQIERKEDDYQGTGLGLTIVKKLVDLFEGTISLSSEENKGTTITFILPFKSGTVVKKNFIQNIEVDLSETETYHILVVEDNKINQVVTKRLLENHCFTCKIVDDGFTAIDLLETEKFDAILMDINMPKINGFETSKIIREKGFTIPIIAVTAFEKDEIIDKVNDAKMNDVIVKPFDPADLFSIVRKLIQADH